MSGRAIAGRYELEQPLGGGGMGSVWLAHAVAGLSHPNILFDGEGRAKIADFGMLTGRTPFRSNSAMELVRMHREEEAPAVESFREDAPPVLAGLALAALDGTVANMTTPAPAAATPATTATTATTTATTTGP